MSVTRNTENIDASILDLPDELKISILGEFTPIELAATGSFFFKYPEFNSVWRTHFSKNFPHYLTKVLENKKEVDWRVEFGKAYRKDYKGLSKEEKHLFYLVKEDDLNKIKKIKNILDLALQSQDRCGKSFFSWARQLGHQSILDYIYELALQSIEDPQQQLFWAVRCNQKAAIAGILAKGVNVDEINASGSTPLACAAFHGHTDIIEELLKCGATVNKRALYDNTPLFVAARQGNKDAVLVLLKHKASARLGFHELGGTIGKECIYIKNLLTLCAYLENLRKYTTASLPLTISLYGRQMKEKLAAAAALKSVLVDGADPAILANYNHILEKGTLAEVSRVFRKIGVLKPISLRAMSDDMCISVR